MNSVAQDAHGGAAFVSEGLVILGSPHKAGNEELELGRSLDPVPLGLNQAKRDEQGRRLNLRAGFRVLMVPSKPIVL